jgi:hypothetical protein
MATLTIGGRSFEIAPYKLGALRQAAPHIDAINAAASIETIEGLMENAEHIVAILGIGLRKIDASLTPEALDDLIGADDMQMLGTALRDVLAESGLAPKGEATAPTEPTEAAGA